LIALVFAFRGSGRGVIVSALLCYVVHPANVFLLPIVAAVYLVQALRRAAGDVRAQRAVLLRTLAVSAAAVAAVGAVSLSRPNVKGFYGQFYRPADWAAYLGSFQRFLFMSYMPLPAVTRRLNALAFWGVLAVAIPLGLRRLARDRRWDVLALFAGLAASAAGFHLVAGSNVFGLDTYRYGMFLVAPTVLAVACLLGRALDRPAAGRPGWKTLAVASVIGWALLASVKLTYFDYYTHGTRLSLWKPRHQRTDSKQRALQVILDDIAREPGAGGRRVIVAEDWWLYRPLQFLAQGRKDVKVVWYERLSEDAARRAGRLRELFDGGAYLVAYPGRAAEHSVAPSFSPVQVRTWVIPDRWGSPYVSVHRLRGPGEGGPATAAPRIAAAPAPERR
jgi:hypothetical protein